MTFRCRRTRNYNLRRHIQQRGKDSKHWDLRVLMNVGCRRRATGGMLFSDGPDGKVRWLFVRLMESACRQFD